MFNEFFFRGLRKFYRIATNNTYDWYDESQVQYRNQEANDLLREKIENATSGLMVSKFGTIELTAVCCCKRVKEGLRVSDYLDYIRGKGCIFPDEIIQALHINAGFFPLSIEMENRFVELVLQDIKDIDVLGSYVDQEQYLQEELKHCLKVNLNGYYAPFLWKNPWTKALEGKRVLVVHPFTESIKLQYEKRIHLFKNPDVLPEFSELILVKAVQSIAGNEKQTGFSDWFQALDAMKYEIDSHEYDIALIGCGAYGMNLAAHVKRQGKIAIHLAGWTQMLFGIYGNRWVQDQPEFAKFINPYWIRPSADETPKSVEKVENACYW